MMKFTFCVLITCLLLFVYSCQQQALDKPPVARVQNVVDEYYSVKVDDPYRYMENLEDSEVKAWIKGQADYAAGVLDAISGRAGLYNRLKELDAGRAFVTSSRVRCKDGTLFYLKRVAGENSMKLYMRTGDEEKLLIDPEKLTVQNNQHYSIYYYTPSPDKNYVVYGLDQGGSEQTTLYTLDLKTNQVLPETIDNIETAYNKPRWTPDSKGFFYARRQELPADAPKTEIYKNTKVYYHQLGTPADQDQLIVGRDFSPLVPLGEVDFPSVYLTETCAHAVLKIKHGDANELTLYSAPVKTLLTANIPWQKVCDVADTVTDYDIHGDDIYLQTARQAPRFKIVRTSLSNPDFSSAETIVTAGEKVVESVYTAQDALYVGVLDGGYNRILRIPYGKKTEAHFLDLPHNSSGYIVSVSKDIDGILIYSSSWTKASQVYAYLPESDTLEDTGLMPPGTYTGLDKYTSQRVDVKSHDGVMIPLSIIYDKDLELDGKNPTLIKGYGAYGFASEVYFNPLNLAWLEKGGILAVAHVRGGGEYGKEWHLAGQKTTKPNTWKDFIACAEYLIAQRYTSTPYLAGQGGSAGGILIGRAITERPDLFAAAIINVGDLDAVRAETTTNGVPNIPEFGTVTIEEEFHALLEMSSYHQVTDGVPYPAVLLTHGFNDPRVEPWQSAKMTARLQAATSSDNPVLFRVDYSAGHGKGSTREQHIRQTADQMAFLLWQFGLAI